MTCHSCDLDLSRDLRVQRDVRFIFYKAENEIFVFTPNAVFRDQDSVMHLHFWDGDKALHLYWMKGCSHVTHLISKPPSTSSNFSTVFPEDFKRIAGA